MHIIKDCPRCGKDFMHHANDYHLSRAVALDADTKEPCSFDTICQDCHEIECVAGWIREKADSRGWENAEAMAIDKYGEVLVAKAMEFIDQNPD